MPKIILICGLPGSGKTTLAEALCKVWDAVHLDGDRIRNAMNNWDFSSVGREKQALAMGRLAKMHKEQGRNVVLSFVAPTAYLRALVWADFTIYMDTIVASPYQDTNALFVPPQFPSMVFHEWTAPGEMARAVLDMIQPRPPVFDWLKPTALMVGRFQPWHKGHRALFEAALKKYGQVCIAVRAMPNNDQNPINPGRIMARIEADLKPDFGGRFAVIFVPNTAAVVYGRNVGYKIENFVLPDEIEKISATKIREGAHGIFS